MRALLFAGLVTIAAAAALAACSGGGDGDAEQAPALIAPTASVPAGPPSATIAPAAALTLIVVSDGATDELLLEWTGGPANATKWQYRRATWNQKKSVPNPWGDWMDIPGSTASDPCPTPTAAPPGVEATPIPGCSGSGGRGTWIEDFASGSILTWPIGYQGDE